MIWDGSNILRSSPHELASLIPPLLNWQSFHQPNWVKRRSVIEMRRNLLVTMMVNEDEWGGRVCKDNYLWLMMTTWRRLLRRRTSTGGDIFSPGHKNCGIHRPDKKTNLRQILFANKYKYKYVYRNKYIWAALEHKCSFRKCHTLFIDILIIILLVFIHFHNQDFFHYYEIWSLQGSNWRFFSDNAVRPNNRIFQHLFPNSK